MGRLEGQREHGPPGVPEYHGSFVGAVLFDEGP